MSLQKKLKNVYTVWYLLTLKRSFDGNPARIKADQNRKIHRLMKRAYRIPVYREKFEQSGTTPDDYHSAEDLVKFPTLTKPELRLWMQTEWDEHPEIHDDINILSTSGSSGTPLKMLYTQKEQACSDANWARALAAAGYKPLRGKMYSFSTSHKGPRKKDRDSIVQKFGLMRRKVVGEDHIVGDGIADLIKDINDYKPDLICLRRNVMVRMVAYAESHNMEIWKPQFYAPISEMVDGVTRKMLAKALGPGLIDAYGVSEMGSFIYEFPGVGYRYVANDIAVANVYNDSDAAEYVLSSGIDVNMIGLDVTLQTIVTDKELGFWQTLNTLKSRKLFDIAAYYYFNEFKEVKGGALHDPLAVEAAVNPDIADDWLRINLTVDQEGVTRGRIHTTKELMSREHKNVNYALNVDADTFIRRFADTVSEVLK